MTSGPSRGFTLLEILMVLAIAAGAYAVLAASLGGGGASSADLKAGARTVAAGLRQAQSTAMSTRRDALLTLDIETREFRLTGEERTFRLPEKLDLQVYTAQGEVESDKRASIRFYPDGSSTGGRVTVASGERKYLVDVEWLTGRVKILE
jgi:general secretion pathway protein H